METLLQNTFEQFSEQISGQMDARLRECCEAWGIDPENKQEVFGRCIITTRDWSDLKEFRIDGHVVMYFTDWKLDAQDINEPFKLSASFKCSKILTPSDYGIKK